MKVRIIIGANAYANIKTLHCNMDVLLAPGRGAAQSLRETAKEWSEKAARYQQRALYLNEAAALLDEQEA